MKLGPPGSTRRGRQTHSWWAAGLVAMDQPHLWGPLSFYSISSVCGLHCQSSGPTERGQETASLPLPGPAREDPESSLALATYICSFPGSSPLLLSLLFAPFKKIFSSKKMFNTGKESILIPKPRNYTCFFLGIWNIYLGLFFFFPLCYF